MRLFDPASTAGWIRVVGWEKFQHYGDRRPIWIKTYLDLLDRDEYLELTAGTRSVLHGLWLMTARTRGRVRADTRKLSRQLNLRVTSEHLTSLSDAGFIEITASAPASNPASHPASETGADPYRALRASAREHARGEEEEEEEEPTTKPPPAGRRPTPLNALKEAIRAVGPQPTAADAHNAIASHLASEGHTVQTEVWMNDRGDGHRGRIDLVIDNTLAVELDWQSPREKSIIKLRQFDGQRAIVLREGNPPQPPAGIDAILALSANGTTTRQPTKRELARYTGCRITRGTHGAGYKHDPLGTDKPPPDWPHPKPSHTEILTALADVGDPEP